MSFFSLLAGKVINVAADGIIAVALHVPFLMHALMSIPYNPPPHATHTIASSTYGTAATNPEYSPRLPSIPSTNLTPEQEAAWEAKNAELQKLKCTDLCVPFDRNNFFAEEKHTKEGYVFSSSSIQPTVSLVLLNDERYAAPNPTFGVYVASTSVGTAGGQFLSQPSFSPNGKYFAFREVDYLGSGDFDTMIYVVNLITNEISEIPTFGLRDGGDAAKNPFVETMSYDESYSWSGDNIIVTQYTLQMFPGEEGYFRVSPINHWEFDLSNFTKPIHPGTLLNSK